MLISSLVPAYGRNYNSRKEIIKAMAENKDFILNNMGGQGYCSFSDFPNADSFQVRYGKRLQKVTVIKRKEVENYTPEPKKKKSLRNRPFKCNECQERLSLEEAEVAMYDGCPNCNSGDIDIV